MNCEYCKNKLSAYIDNELSSEERLLVEKHLKTCPPCAREVETLNKLGVLFGDVPEETPSPAFVQMTINKAAVITRGSLWSRRFLSPTISFVRSAVAFIFAPGGYGALGGKNLFSHGYLRAFDDSPPGSFASVYFTVIQGDGN